MGGSSYESLRQLLATRTRDAISRALQTNGELESDRLAELERLARLVALADTSQARDRRRRWPLAVALLTTLVLASVLLFFRVSETVIELEVEAREIGFTLPQSQRLTDDLALVSLTASGLSQVEFPRSDAGGRERKDAAQITVTVDGAKRGNLHLAALTPAEGAKIRFDSKIPGVLNLSIQDAPQPQKASICGAKGMPQVLKASLVATRDELQTLKASLGGPVQIALSGSAPQSWQLPSPRELAMFAPPNVIDLELQFARAVPIVLVSQIKACALSLTNVDQIDSTSGPLLRYLSTILSGTLVFEELDSAKRTLRTSELLHFDESDGVIRTLEWRGDRVFMNFRGTVRGLRSGDDVAARNLMPTWLEWLRAQHGLSLLWGSSLYIFGLVAAALRWWGVKT